jgi:hypothetical protein
MFAGTGATCEDFVRINSLRSRRELGRRLATGDYVVTVDGDRATAKGRNLGVFSLKKVDACLGDHTQSPCRNLSTAQLNEIEGLVSLM